ncbi:NF-kappa-B inhibitor-like protein 1 [Clytia hemisphaerica]|uniref:NF-kappa-B inhibitor-like protein 1 n=1 Tax=Clytia hemisphaerica TaxID=252671 RepID=A0A7M5X5L6_9CNID
MAESEDERRSTKRKNDPSSRKKSKSKKKRKRKHRQTEEEKIFKKFDRYLQDGRLLKMEKYYQKFVGRGSIDYFIDEINETFGDRGWTYLHKYSSTGELAIVKFLISHHADLTFLDKKDNLFLHYAFNYVIESFDRPFLYYIIFDVLPEMGDKLLTQRNEYGETPVDLLDEIMQLLQKSQSQYLIEPESESESELKEKDWNERLFFEMSENDNRYGNEMFFQDEHEDTFRKSKTETFEEWGDRMQSEHNRKHRSKAVPLKTKSRKRENESESTKKRKLGPINNLKELRTNFELLRLREEYEKICDSIFKNNENKNELKFEQIPWLHFPGFDLGELNEEQCLNGMMKLFCHGFTDEDKMKYLKVQRIRWHPDKFMQKCGHRLFEKDRERILSFVKSVSQRINTEITNIG